MEFNPKEFLAMSDEELGQYLYVLRLDLKYLISLDHPICYAERADGVLTQKTGYLVDANLAHAMRDEFIEKHGVYAWLVVLHKLYPLAKPGKRFNEWLAGLSPAEIIAVVLMAENETKGSE